MLEHVLSVRTTLEKIERNRQERNIQMRGGRKWRKCQQCASRSRLRPALETNSQIRNVKLAWREYHGHAVLSACRHPTRL